MSVYMNAEAPAPSVDADETGYVAVFRYGGVTYLVDSDGANALHCADRSQTLSDMPEAQGRSTLPLSLTTLRLWQDAIACMDAEDCLPLEWRASTRVQDLCTLATVCLYFMLGRPLCRKSCSSLYPRFCMAVLCHVCSVSILVR